MGLERAGVRCCSRIDDVRTAIDIAVDNRVKILIEPVDDAGMLDGMDCGSGWQPDLLHFAQRRNGGIRATLCQMQAPSRARAARFFKMKLIHAATVALRKL